MSAAEMSAAEPAGADVALPAWRRRTPGEHRWPAATAVGVAVVLQVLLPDPVLPPLTRWALPAVELGLLVALSIADPFRIDRESAVLRALGLTVLGAVALSNTWSVVLLADRLITGHDLPAGTLLSAGAAIWATTVLVFGLAYWEFDRGGPAARAAGRQAHPDFLFVQMQNPDMAPADWEPQFLDYLYLAFTSSTAFSPTDVMPLSRWAKMMMMGQEGIALVVVVLVVARAVNVLA